MSSITHPTLQSGTKLGDEMIDMIVTITTIALVTLITWAFLQLATKQETRRQALITMTLWGITMMLLILLSILPYSLTGETPNGSKITPDISDIIPDILPPAIQHNDIRHEEATGQGRVGMAMLAPSTTLHDSDEGAVRLFLPLVLRWPPRTSGFCAGDC